VLFTCISILAVDFTVFPREYAKTETFGISLMDVGVGTFIVSSAITSKFARNADVTVSNNSPRPLAGSSSSALISFVTRITRVTFQHVIVLVLGFGRFVVLKLLNYQEHVSEYGIHWNFFVTLFCVWTAADIIHTLRSPSYVLCFALMWLIVYQYILVSTDLTDYLMGNERSSLVDANKEGIFSLCGYVPLYLMAECLARYTFHQNLSIRDECSFRGTGMANPAESDKGKKTAWGEKVSMLKGAWAGMWREVLVRRLSVISFVAFAVWYVSNTFVQSTSRRLVNFSYVSLSLALAASMCLVLYGCDMLAARCVVLDLPPIVLSPDAVDSMPPQIYVTSTGDAYAATTVLSLHCLSKHSLVVFMVANLLTGAVNFSIRTIYAPPLTAMTVLVCYTSCVLASGWIAEIVSVWLKQGLRAAPK
jgi:glucosaminylphosphatidylinositol acyltransferase